MDDAESTLSGSAFQILAAATGEAWLPMFDSFKVIGIYQQIGVFVVLTGRASGPRYCGTAPCRTLYTAVFYCIHIPFL